MQKRIFEIDALRGAALILMMIFHIAVDLSDFFGMNFDYNRGIIGVIGPLSAYIFITVAGISATFSRSNLKHGLTVLACGLPVTAASYIMAPDAPIIFGILQFMGTAMIIFHFLRELKVRGLAVCAAIAVLPHIFFRNTYINTYLLLPIGIMPTGFVSLDYYPLSPYAALFFIGAIIGKTVYSKKTTLFESAVCKFKFLSFLGRHSMAVYLIHQPIFLLVLFLIFSCAA